MNVDSWLHIPQCLTTESETACESAVQSLSYSLRESFWSALFPPFSDRGHGGARYISTTWNYFTFFLCISASYQAEEVHLYLTVLVAYLGWLGRSPRYSEIFTGSNVLANALRTSGMCVCINLSTRGPKVGTYLNFLPSLWKRLTTDVRGFYGPFEFDVNICYDRSRDMTHQIPGKPNTINFRNNEGMSLLQGLKISDC